MRLCLSCGLRNVMPIGPVLEQVYAGRTDYSVWPQRKQNSKEKGTCPGNDMLRSQRCGVRDIDENGSVDCFFTVVYQTIGERFEFNVIIIIVCSPQR